MSYGNDGPCTLAEAQEDDEDRVTIRLTPAEVAQIIHAHDIPSGTAKALIAAIQSGAQGSAAPVDVPVTDRAGEAALRAEVERLIRHAKADALDEFADLHVHHQTPARMAEDMRDRADEYREGPRS